MLILILIIILLIELYLFIPLILYNTLNWFFKKLEKETPSYISHNSAFGWRGWRIAKDLDSRYKLASPYRLKQIAVPFIWESPVFKAQSKPEITNMFGVYSLDIRNISRPYAFYLTDIIAFGLVEYFGRTIVGENGVRGEEVIVRELYINPSFFKETLYNTSDLHGFPELFYMINYFRSIDWNISEVKKSLEYIYQCPVYIIKPIAFNRFHTSQIALSLAHGTKYESLVKKILTVS